MVPIVHAGSATVFKSDVQERIPVAIVAEQLYVIKPADRRTRWCRLQNAEPLEPLLRLDES